jgi:uncharacterized membrane protein
MAGKRSIGEQARQIIRLESRESVLRTLVGTIVGVAIYVILNLVSLPEYKLMGIVTVGISLSLLVIPLAAAFLGPLAGFLVGLLGTLGVDVLLTQQIVAFGTVNLAYGLLGLIIGVPCYTQRKGFSKSRTLGKLILASLSGFLVMILVYLVGLIVIAGQNILPTMLFNFLPFSSVSLITLVIVAPVAVSLVDTVSHYSNVIGRQIGPSADSVEYRR